MGLERRGYGQLGLRIPVQNVDELILLDRRNQACASLGITGKVLARNDPPHSRLAESLQMQAVEAVLGGEVLDDGDAAGISGQYQVVWGTASAHETAEINHQIARRSGGLGATGLGRLMNITKWPSRSSV